MRTLNAGSLVHQVTIQRLTDGVDATGAPDESWATLVVAQMGRPSVWRGRGAETFTADQIAASIVTLWTMKYVAAMDPDLVDVPKQRRLLYQARVYDIIEAVTMDRRIGLLLRTLASTRVPS